MPRRELDKGRGVVDLQNQRRCFNIRHSTIYNHLRLLYQSDASDSPNIIGVHLKLHLLVWQNKGVHKSGKNKKQSQSHIPHPVLPKLANQDEFYPSARLTFEIHMSKVQLLQMLFICDSEIGVV